jgi:hypothetical protein
MRKIAPLVIVTVLVAAGPVAAQIDPDPNMCGIYFDEGAMVYCIDVDQGGQVTAYFCLTRITAPSGVGYWEAAIESSDPSSILAWSPRGGGFNALTPPEFAVTLETPLLWQSALVVLEITVDVQTPHPIVFRIGPVANPSVPGDPFPLPAYSPGSNPSIFRTLGYSFGWNPETGLSNWCAVINSHDDCAGDPAAGAVTTWGRIKSIYGR